MTPTGPRPLPAAPPPEVLARPIVVEALARLTSVSSQRAPSTSSARRAALHLDPGRVALLDLDALVAELVRHKAARGWHSLVITRSPVAALLARRDWYRIDGPADALSPALPGALERWQRLAAALLRGYCGRVVALAGDKPRYTPPP